MSGEELGRPRYTAAPKAVADSPASRRPLADPAAPVPDSAAPRGRRARQTPPARRPPTPWPEPADADPQTPQMKLRKAPKQQPQQPKPKPEKAPKQRDEPVADAPPTAYVPPPGRSIGYVLWRLVRGVVVAVAWLAVTMVKVALKAFTHI